MLRRLVLVLLFVLPTLASPLAALEMTHERLAIAGAPASILSADLDGDGRRDLVTVLASTRWGQVGIEEPQRIDASGAYAEALTIVPMLFDRRVLAVFRGLPEGGFAVDAAMLELPTSVHALVAGTGRDALLAWTDEGFAAVELAGSTLSLTLRIALPSPLAGSRAFLNDLPLATDLDGDGVSDLLAPTGGGIEVHLGSRDGFAAKAASVVPDPLGERLPGDASHYRDGGRRLISLPEAVDLDGDRLPELVFREHDRGLNRVRIARNLGGGRFAASVDPLAGRARDAEPEVVWIGDLDGGGRGEIVTAEELEPEADTMRAGLEQARRPRYRYRVHELGDALLWNPEPVRTFELTGYVFGGGEQELGLPQGILDLDGDGRTDVVALTLDFSLFQALRVLTVRSLHLGLEFHPYCQREDGTLAPVADSELGGQFTIHLERLRLGQLISFAGDFDGDGRHDYLQLGHGRQARIRFGAPGCRFPSVGEAQVRLATEPSDLALVRVLDLDGDGRSDLIAIDPPRTGAVDGRGALDLYVTRGRR